MPDSACAATRTGPSAETSVTRPFSQAKETRTPFTSRFSARPDAVVEKLEAGDEPGAMALLDAHREKLLARFHQSRECIDCVDYLVYQLQKKG